MEESHTHQHAAEKLGTVSFPTSCAPAVQKTFERGVALLHSFMYDEAKRQFTEIKRRDARCAMAHWGSIMSASDFWSEVPPDVLKRANAEIRQAKALHSTPRERAYIAALAAFYEEGQHDHAARAKALAEGMAMVHRDYPDDLDGAAFYALALLASAPPNDTSFINAKQAIAILDPLFARYPNHPGLAHYLIHVCDAPQLAPLGLDAARRYAAIAPSSAHALHMPSHIFARLGMWQEDIQSNLASITAARQRVAMHRGGEVDQLHATDFLVYALLQVGGDKSASSLVEGVPAVVAGISNPKKRKGLIWTEAHFPALFALEAHHWTDAAALMPPPNATPRVATETYWARTFGAARIGDAEGARKDAVQYEALLDQLRHSDKSYLVQYLDLEHDEVLAWRDFAEKKNEAAVQLMRSVADRQDARGKEEVALPAREMLADMLLELNHPEAALAEYEQSMKIDPNRFNALYGAGRAAELTHQREKARSYYAALVKNCKGSKSYRPELARARAALEDNNTDAK